MNEDARKEYVAQRVAGLVQGVILQFPSLPFLSTHDEPLHPAAVEQVERRSKAVPNKSSGPMLSVSISPTGYVVLISQTCDLQERRTLQGRTLVQVAQVVSLADSPLLSDAMNLAKPQYVPLPWFGEHYFADLDHVATFDRSLLASIQDLSSPVESQRRRFSYLLGRYYSRPALPDDVVKALKPLQKKAEEGKQASLRRIMDDAVEQIRVLPEPPFDSGEKSHLTIYFLLDPDWYPEAQPADLGRQLGKAAHNVADALVELFDKAEDVDHGKIVQLWRELLNRFTVELNEKLAQNSSWPISGFTTVPVVALTANEYEASDLLDLGYLSLSGDD